MRIFGFVLLAAYADLILAAGGNGARHDALLSLACLILAIYGGATAIAALVRLDKVHPSPTSWVAPRPN